MRVNVVNGFSEHPEGGNPAGVVYLNEELCLKEQNRHQDCDGEKPEHLTDEQMQEVESLILDRLGIIKPSVRQDAEAEIEQFIDSWKRLAAESRPLKYKGPLFRKKDQKYNALMGYYGGDCADTEKPTLTSMRDVEGAANMFYYEGD